MFDIYNNINEKQDVVIGLQIDNIIINNNLNDTIGDDKNLNSKSDTNNNPNNNKNITKFNNQSKKVKNKSNNSPNNGGELSNRDNPYLSDEEYDKLYLTYEHTCKSLDKQTC